MTTTHAVAYDAGKKAAGIGLKAALRILDKWGAKPGQVMNILRISRPSYYNYVRAPEAASLNPDQIERISYLLNIHAVLRVVFENPENIDGFMGLKNDNPYFNGSSPLEVISSGNFGALYETFKRIDSLRGTGW